MIILFLRRFKRDYFFVKDGWKLSLYYFVLQLNLVTFAERTK